MTGIIGAICGDAIGVPYEFFQGENIKIKDFELITEKSGISDDSVHTLAVADWLMNTDRSHQALVDIIVAYTNKYRNFGYGEMMYTRCVINKKLEPYNSWGNGSAMRVSPVAWVAQSEEECLELAKRSAEVSHNHPEGIKGAQATAIAIWMNRNGYTKDDIKDYIEENFKYDLSTTVNEIRPHYHFDVSCQGSVPQAIRCWYESTDYEDCLRNVISIGGDADTQGAIAGAICAANPETDVPEWIVSKLFVEMNTARFDNDLRDVYNEFHEKFEM